MLTAAAGASLTPTGGQARCDSQPATSPAAQISAVAATRAPRRPSASSGSRSSPGTGPLAELLTTSLLRVSSARNPADGRAQERAGIDGAGRLRLVAVDLEVQVRAPGEAGVAFPPQLGAWQHLLPSTHGLRLDHVPVDDVVVMVAGVVRNAATNPDHYVVAVPAAAVIPRPVGASALNAEHHARSDAEDGSAHLAGEVDAVVTPVGREELRDP